MAAAKIVNLQTLIKHDIMPESSSPVLDCDKNCPTSENPAERSELIEEITPQDTQELLRSDDTLKHKVVYLAGYLVYKYGDSTSMEEIIGDEDIYIYICNELIEETQAQKADFWHVGVFWLWLQ